MKCETEKKRTGEKDENESMSMRANGHLNSYVMIYFL